MLGKEDIPRRMKVGQKKKKRHTKFTFLFSYNQLLLEIGYFVNTVYFPKFHEKK